MNAKEIKINKDKKPSLNEAIIGNCNMEVPEADVETNGAVPEVYADAINQRAARKEKIEKDFQEQDKLVKDFIDSEEKKLNLSESLFEETTPIYKEAEELSDKLTKFMEEHKDIVNNDDYFDQKDRHALYRAQYSLQNFAVEYAHIMDNENVFEAVDTEAPEKKRTRGANEIKYGIDYSDNDLWLQVYDELDASLDNEGEGQQVNRFVKGRKGDRYRYIFPHGDNDIVVGAISPDKFDFAKKVADYYGVTYDEPKEDKNPRTNQYYKWTMVIHIPEESEPIEKH